MKHCGVDRKRSANERGLILFLLFWWSEITTCFCPFRCHCNEDTLTVWCDGASLNVVPITLNPGLHELHLNSNKIKSITASFTVYQNLRYLDMSQNLLTSLGNANFDEQKELLELYLNSNRIKTLKSNVFMGMSSLKVLRLDNNLIDEIADNAFESLYSLETLDLSRNRISTLSSSTFYGLLNLKELILRDNKLAQVPTESFRNIKHLQSLDLGMNAMHLVPKNAFHHLRRLKTLRLDSCGLHILEPGAFMRLDSLVSVFLQDNELQHVPTGVLLDVPYLQELHIGRNGLQSLKPGDFGGLQSLSILTVNGEDRLETIYNGTFQDNVLLERLIISNNKILNWIEPGTLQRLPNLRFLSLRGNNFATFQEDMLPWNKLDLFDVRENPLICNCSLLWLWDLLNRENFTTNYGEDVTRVRCISPTVVTDQLLKDLSLDDLDCGTRALRQIILAVSVSSAIVILAAIVMLVLWQRYKYASQQKSKLGQSKRTLYQYGQNSENFSPILSQIIQQQQPFKSPGIAEL